jgi:predicted permease
MITSALDATKRDLAHGARRLLATPMFTLFAVVSIAVGLAVTATASALVYDTLWKPVGVADPESLFVVSVSSERGYIWQQALSEPDLDDLAGSAPAAGRIAASALFYGTLADGPMSDIVLGEAVTGRYHETMRVTPVLGRVLLESDDAPGAPEVVVLSDRLWRRRYGSDPDVIGRTLRVDGIAFEVVGVTPASFWLRRDVGTDLWVTRSAARRHGLSTSGRARQDRSVRTMTVVSRPTSDADRAALAAQVAAISARLDAEFPRRAPGVPPDGALLPPRDWRLQTLDEATAAGSARTMAAGQAAIGLAALVLLVASSNVANLMLARGATRMQEFAVLHAFGASRARLVRTVAAEGMLLAGAGGFAAVLLMQVLLAAATLDLPLANGRSVRLEPTLQPPVLLVAGMSLGAALLIFGVGPALRLTRGDLRPVSGHAIGVSAVPRRRLWRSTRWQVATATLLFLVAAILVRVVVQERRTGSGIDEDRLAVAVVHFDAARGQDRTYAHGLVDAVLTRMRQTPGIESAAASAGVPFGLTITPLAKVATTGRLDGDAAQAQSALAMLTTPWVFETLGVPIVAGRPIEETDDEAGASPVAVVSETQARNLFGRSDASVLGREIDVQVWARPPTLSLRVIGIAGDTDVGSRMSRGTGLVYLPRSLAFSPGWVFLARSADPGAAAAALRTAITQADRDLGVWTAGPAPAMLAGGYAVLRMLSAVTLGLAGVALLLSMVGLYGVLSHVISRQMRELGLRMALGATAGGLRRQTVAQGLRPVAAGLILGVAVALLARAAIRVGLGAPIEILDLAATATVCAAIGAAAVLACWLPARRAARVDPQVALRDL